MVCPAFATCSGVGGDTADPDQSPFHVPVSVPGSPTKPRRDPRSRFSASSITLPGDLRHGLTAGRAESSPGDPAPRGAEEEAATRGSSPEFSERPFTGRLSRILDAQGHTSWGSGTRHLRNHPGGLSTLRVTRGCRDGRGCRRRGRGAGTGRLTGPPARAEAPFLSHGRWAHDGPGLAGTEFQRPRRHHNTRGEEAPSCAKQT